MQIQRPFDPFEDSFTLEKIIELGMDNFAAKINEVSSSASKEMMIENVITDCVF